MDEIVIETEEKTTKKGPIAKDGPATVVVSDRKGDEEELMELSLTGEGLGYAIQRASKEEEDEIPSTEHLPARAELQPGKPSVLTYFVGGLIAAALLLAAALVAVGSLPVRGLLFILLDLLLVPAVSYLVWWRWHQNKASWHRISLYLLAGAAGAFFILVVEVNVIFLFDVIFDRLIFSVLESHGIEYAYLIIGVIIGFPITAVIEESLKFVFAERVEVTTNRDFAFSVVVYTVIGALGFCVCEYYVFILVYPDSKGVFLLWDVFFPLVRLTFLVPMHIATSFLIGADVAERKYSIRHRHFLRIVWLPVLVHGLVNMLMWTTLGLTLSSTTTTTRTWSLILFCLFLAALVDVSAGVYAYFRAKAVFFIEENRGVQLENIEPPSDDVSAPAPEDDTPA
eukprot:CAMPEP_0177686404 /NCGR_PEP_ID=MMETSP0447-20121125/33550_1 /TAXON_ID=0 /ORGANISM="Stygamoeba regulata, Strain BSH-02190019" /LENGTH=396 /DNA_ID=CAMNT_0019196523 /DNA_START=183 /DNA_END=1373 /DNA_ORIENTATION=-